MAADFARIRDKIDQDLQDAMEALGLGPDREAAESRATRSSNTTTGIMSQSQQTLRQVMTNLRRDITAELATYQRSLVEQTPDATAGSSTGKPTVKVTTR